jgi:hypothetical protein
MSRRFRRRFHNQANQVSHLAFSYRALVQIAIHPVPGVF